MSAGADTGTTIGVARLHDLWERAARARAGGGSATGAEAFALDDLMLRGLGVGLHETFAHLYDERPSFAAFERWVVARNDGAIESARVARINAALAGEAIGPEPDAAADPAEPVLSAADLAFWDEQGYVVVPGAVSAAACAAAAAAVWSFLAADPDQPDTWYGTRIGRSLWVPLLHHPALRATRRAPRIRRAFRDLWQRDDLWTTVDQAGFNPPQRPDRPFAGQSLHWDTSLVPPIPLDVQGVLYLTDTAADQGAFTCVPGFHRRIERWLTELPSGANPRRQDLRALGARPVAGRAGDLIIWHHALPHGSSPNRALSPRIVQYVKLQPLRGQASRLWR